MKPAGEEHARAREQAIFDRAGTRAEVVGVHAAGHAHHPVGRDAERQPLALDLGGDRGEAGVCEDGALERPCAAGSCELFGLAVVAGARRLHQSGLAAQERPGETRRDRFPERLVGVDQVDVGAQAAECPDDAGEETQREERAAGDGLDPAVDEDAAMFFIVDRKAGNGPGDDVDGVPAPGELGALREGLSLGAAFKRVEVAHDVADAQGRLLVVRDESSGFGPSQESGSWTLRSFLKWG